LYCKAETGHDKPLEIFTEIVHEIINQSGKGIDGPILSKADLNAIRVIQSEELFERFVLLSVLVIVAYRP
jgi:hypothetical protein